ncbi:hypothetical protein ACVWWG_007639 [Bradyrhizobium sp. LB7.2]
MWITVEVERVLRVDRGRNIILCDPMLGPFEQTLVLKLKGSEMKTPELTATCTKLLPGGIIDDSTYSQIEDALDAIDAPMTGDGGRYLTIAERIAALALSRPNRK